MPKNVARTSDGFEDPDDFFKSPTGTIRSTHGNRTPGTATTSRTRGRLSGLTSFDDDDDEMQGLDGDEYQAESLLADDGDLLGGELGSLFGMFRPDFFGIELDTGYDRDGYMFREEEDLEDP